jgi:L-fuconolactonase
MTIVDGQLHEPPVWLGWSALDDDHRDRLLAELALAAMTAVGVDRAVLVPGRRPWAERAARAMPDRFALVPVCSQKRVAEGDTAALVAEERANPAVKALRIVITAGSPRWQTATKTAVPPGTPAHHDMTAGVRFAEEGGYDEFLAACVREDMPLFVFSPTRADVVERMAERHPDLRLIVDHLGISQPPVADADDPPFRHLADVVKLARFPNVAVKVCGAPALSAEPYPYPDLWAELSPLVAAFGAERLMWASDFSRILGRTGFHRRNPHAEAGYQGKHTYAESLGYLRDAPQLTPEEKDLILGGTAQRLLGWS